MQVQREKMSMNKNLSIITLNVNGLNAPIERHTVAEWIRGRVEGGEGGKWQ